MECLSASLVWYWVYRPDNLAIVIVVIAVVCFAVLFCVVLCWCVMFYFVRDQRRSRAIRVFRINGRNVMSRHVT